MKGENIMNFPKSILIITYFPSYKNSAYPDYIPICITSVANAKNLFWVKEYELFEIEQNGELRLFKEWGIE